MEFAKKVEIGQTMTTTKRRCTGCKREIDSWEALPLVGYQDDCEGGFLELRNHHCGSTLSVRAGAPPTAAASPEVAAAE
jgi:hypothetical protein